LRDTPNRRDLLIAGAAGAGSLALGGCMSLVPASPPADQPPIVFAHGNGDTAALWTTTIWRFESNGWPRERLHAIDLPYPLARDDDGKAQPGRTSTAEHTAYLAREIQKVLARTGAAKVALVGNSRGGYPIRNYLLQGGGAGTVSHAVLGGVPNHGVWADAAFAPKSEFNGTGPFLRALNAPQGADGTEVTPGLRWLTIRSDNNDKFAQPDGAWIGRKGTATNIGFDGPALKGAENVVIAGIDHRETSFSAKAFAETYRFIAGRPAATLAIVPEAQVVLDGTVSGSGLENKQGAFANNLPLVGATVEVYAVAPATGERVGAPRHRKTIGGDGRWGPFTADGAAHHEFVIAAPGYATTHIYRSPFPRSSTVVSLRADRLSDADRADAAMKSLVVLSRPRGYFGVPRDRIVLDGASPPPGLAPGVAGLSVARLKVTDTVGRAVVGEFNGERLVGRAWPAAEGHVVLLELTY